MPAFADPYDGNIKPRKPHEEHEGKGNPSKQHGDKDDKPQIDYEGLMQALRLDMASELEAMYLYDAHAEFCPDPLVKKQLEDIRDEERKHFGELHALMCYLDPKESTLVSDGCDEVIDTMKELKMKIPLSMGM